MRHSKNKSEGITTIDSRTLEQRVGDLRYQAGQGSLFTAEEERKSGIAKNDDGTLVEAERILDAILSDNKKRWVEIYQVLCSVRDSEAYKSACSSFTGWVNHYAKKSHISAQILWKYYSCGNYYRRISEAQKERGRSLNLQAEDLSPDNMILIGKITKNDPEKGGELAIKTVRGELGRTGLQAMWKREKMERKHRGEKMTRINGYDTYDNHDGAGDKEASQPPRMQARQIVSALCSNSLWLPEQVVPRPPYCRNTYLCIPEFPVRTAGKTRHIDLLVAENLTVPASDANYRVVLHGIEIKVDRYDLERDNKMQEYLDFVDVFWLAIPDGDDELYAAAADLLQDNQAWGLLVIESDGDVKVSKRADTKPGLLVKDTLMTIVNRATIKDNLADIIEKKMR